MSINQIFQLGDDALANQAEIIINPLALFASNDPLRLRTTTFDIPEFAIGEYTIDYKTQKFNKPSGKIETPQEFTFNFRADKYWTIYQALLAWKNTIGNDRTGAMSEDVDPITGISLIRTDVIVLTKDSNGTLTSPGWTFSKCWLKNLGGVSFDNASGDPIEVSVTLDFLKMISGT